MRYAVNDVPKRTSLSPLLKIDLPKKKISTAATSAIVTYMHLRIPSRMRLNSRFPKFCATKVDMAVPKSAHNLINQRIGFTRGSVGGNVRAAQRISINLTHVQLAVNLQIKAAHKGLLFAK